MVHFILRIVILAFCTQVALSQVTDAAVDHSKVNVTETTIITATPGSIPNTTSEFVLPAETVTNQPLNSATTAVFTASSKVEAKILSFEESTKQIVTTETTLSEEGRTDKTTGKITTTPISVETTLSKEGRTDKTTGKVTTTPISVETTSRLAGNTNSLRVSEMNPSITEKSDTPITEETKSSIADKIGLSDAQVPNTSTGGTTITQITEVTTSSNTKETTSSNVEVTNASTVVTTSSQTSNESSVKTTITPNTKVTTSSIEEKTSQSDAEVTKASTISQVSNESPVEATSTPNTKETTLSVEEKIGQSDVEVTNTPIVQTSDSEVTNTSTGVTISTTTEKTNSSEKEPQEIRSSFEDEYTPYLKVTKATYITNPSTVNTTLTPITTERHLANPTPYPQNSLPFPKDSHFVKLIPGYLNPKFVAPPPDFKSYVKNIDMYTQWYSLWKKWNEVSHSRDLFENNSTYNIEERRGNDYDFSSFVKQDNYSGKGKKSSLEEFMKHAVQNGGFNIFVNPSYQISMHGHGHDDKIPKYDDKNYNNPKQDNKYDTDVGKHKNDKNDGYISLDQLGSNQSDEEDEHEIISNNNDILKLDVKKPTFSKLLSAIKKGIKLADSVETLTTPTPDVNGTTDSSLPCEVVYTNLTRNVNALENIINDILHYLKTEEDNTGIANRLSDESSGNRPNAYSLISSIKDVIMQGKIVCNETHVPKIKVTTSKPLSPIDWEKIRTLEAKLSAFSTRRPKNMTDQDVYKRNQLYAQLEKLHDGFTEPANEGGEDEEIVDSSSTISTPLQTTGATTVSSTHNVTSKIKIEKLLKETTSTTAIPPTTIPSNATTVLSDNSTKTPIDNSTATTNSGSTVSIFSTKALNNENNSTTIKSLSTTPISVSVTSKTVPRSSISNQPQSTTNSILNKQSITTIPASLSTQLENKAQTTSKPATVSTQTTKNQQSTTAVINGISSTAVTKGLTTGKPDDIPEGFEDRMGMEPNDPCYAKCLAATSKTDKAEISKLFQLLGLGLLDMGHMLLNRDQHNCPIIPHSGYNASRVYNYPQTRP